MRTIDADALIATMENMRSISDNVKQRQIEESILHGIVPQIIDDAPTIEAEPVKHGRWMYPFYCSECGFTPYYSSDLTYNYCPNCGARMEGNE